jgi:hypothetical protein
MQKKPPDQCRSKERCADQAGPGENTPQLSALLASGFVADNQADAQRFAQIVEHNR